MHLVVVESPTKAKTINKYLGSDYVVLASYGHIRDLEEKEKAVDPDADFAMRWELLSDDKKKKAVKEIKDQLKLADRLVLATDPDREGEAISWHLFSVLDKAGLLKDKQVERVVFHEVTKTAVQAAMANPRPLHDDLVDAYLARRALDYLVGYTLSPVLWRKLPGARSAGRVQSVALRLICEREDAIERFVAREYWSVETDLLTERNEGFRARLTHLDGKKLDKFALADEASATAAVKRIEATQLRIAQVEKKQTKRNPAPPFSTSTLQQEAARKLGFGTDQTMRTAQRLFEGLTLGGETVGLITYMRTDSVQLSGEALGRARSVIQAEYGNSYVPEHPRQFKRKTKNAQEAHEAIRPTDLSRLPKEVARYLDADQRRLYELIWKRTIASQMEAAVLDRTTVDIEGDGVMLRATGSTIAFDGFFKVYQEGRDDVSKDQAADDDGDRILPQMTEAEATKLDKVIPEQHFTEPPPRFSEASLVKQLEELGIGRPSTYASIIRVLQDRNYVDLDKKRFIPQDRGRVVSVFLSEFFDRYVQPTFTAEMEDRLDAVAAGEVDWKDVLREFWPPFFAGTEEVLGRRNAEIIDALDAALGPHFFPAREDGSDPRVCPSCEGGRLSIKFGKYGGFIGCTNYPECKFTRQFGAQAEDAKGGTRERLLGVDPVTQEEVWLKVGRFGPYVQSGSGDALKRCSLPKSVEPADVDLDIAIRLLSLPREIGNDPESEEPILAGINRYGPFVQRGRTYVRLDADDDVLSIGMNRALALLAEKGTKVKGPARPTVQGRKIGDHPDDGKPIELLDGRYGPYLKWNKLNASLPKKAEPETLELDEAVEILAQKAAKGKTGKGKTATKAKAAKPAAAKSASAKKPAAKAKSAAKSKATKKPPAAKAKNSGSADSGADQS